MSKWKNEVQKELLKNLVDQLYKLEEENENLRAQKNTSGSTTQAGNVATFPNEIDRIKQKVFGDVDER